MRTGKRRYRWNDSPIGYATTVCIHWEVIRSTRSRETTSAEEAELHGRPCVRGPRRGLLPHLYARRRFNEMNASAFDCWTNRFGDGQVEDRIVVFLCLQRRRLWQHPLPFSL